MKQITLSKEFVERLNAYTCCNRGEDILRVIGIDDIGAVGPWDSKPWTVRRNRDGSVAHGPTFLDAILLLGAKEGYDEDYAREATEIRARLRRLITSTTMEIEAFCSVPMIGHFLHENVLIDLEWGHVSKVGAHAIAKSVKMWHEEAILRASVKEEWSEVLIRSSQKILSGYSKFGKDLGPLD